MAKSNHSNQSDQSDKKLNNYMEKSHKKTSADNRKLTYDFTNIENYLLSWTDLSAVLIDQDKEILTECSGYIKQGEFVTIMGPSGAGKSTFMNIISGRYKSSSTIKINGQVKLNDVNLDLTDFFRISS